MKKIIRNVGLAFARIVGSRIVDANTGKPIGKALLLPWRGKIHVIGLDTTVRPVFVIQNRVTYWKQELGFAQHPPPDFPSLPKGGPEATARSIATSACRNAE